MVAVRKRWLLLSFHHNHNSQRCRRSPFRLENRSRSCNYKVNVKTFQRSLSHSYLQPVWQQMRRMQHIPLLHHHVQIHIWLSQWLEDKCKGRDVAQAVKHSTVNVWILLLRRSILHGRNICTLEYFRSNQCSTPGPSKVVVSTRVLGY